MWEFFSNYSVQCNLQKGDIAYLPPDRSSCYGVNSLVLRGSLLWENLVSDVKQINNLEEFILIGYDPVLGRFKTKVHN